MPAGASPEEQAVEKSAMQVESEAMGIDDTNPSTRGGAPGWLAFAIVGGLTMVVGVIVLMVLGVF
jgi:hypothetical protein